MLTTAVGTALAADRTLGGLCDWVEPEAPEPADPPVEGTTMIRAAMLSVTLYCTSADPLA